MAVFMVICSFILAAGLLFYLLIGAFEKSEPKIVTLKEPIKMIGVSTRTGMKTIFKDAAGLGQKYKQVKDQGLIPNKKAPWAFVAISKNFQGTESWDYLMGDVVNTLDHVPAGLECFEIPASKNEKIYLHGMATSFKL
jgi:predicted transcriptional regulator YdeE